MKKHSKMQLNIPTIRVLQSLTILDISFKIQFKIVTRGLVSQVDSFRQLWKNYSVAKTTEPSKQIAFKRRKTKLFLAYKKKPEGTLVFSCP